jgi:cation transporter-like permease
LVIVLLLFLRTVPGKYRKKLLLLGVNALLILIGWVVGSITFQYIIAGLFAGVIAFLFFRLVFSPDQLEHPLTPKLPSESM